jgi:hypothetical protein
MGILQKRMPDRFERYYVFMNYRHTIVLKQANDYMRSFDLSYMGFLKENHQKTFKYQFDNKRRLYIEEDVNMRKIEKLAALLKEKGYDVGIVSSVAWKSFPDKPDLFE